MNLLDDYFKLQKEIYDYFGYKEDWCVIPLDCGCDYYWTVCEDEGAVRFAETKMMLEQKRGSYCENEIHTQQFLPKHVYRGEEYTMVCVDTHTDGNKFLQVFDNNKEM